MDRFPVRYRAMEVVDGLTDKWPDKDLNLHAGDNQDAARADVVVVATPWDAAAATVMPLADLLAGKVVISMANALAKVAHEFQPLVPPRSVAASIQAAIPQSLVSAAMHHVPAKELGDLGQPGRVRRAGVLRPRRGHQHDARDRQRHPRPAWPDAGELSNAAPIEAFAAVLLQLNVKYRTRAAVRFHRDRSQEPAHQVPRPHRAGRRQACRFQGTSAAATQPFG